MWVRFETSCKCFGVRSIIDGGSTVLGSCVYDVDNTLYTTDPPLKEDTLPTLEKDDVSL